MADNTDFTLSRDSYATFDALTLKQLIKKRLNEVVYLQTKLLKVVIFQLL